jgi:hypothetical protein
VDDLNDADHPNLIVFIAHIARLNHEQREKNKSDRKRARTVH